MKLIDRFFDISNKKITKYGLCIAIFAIMAVLPIIPQIGNDTLEVLWQAMFNVLLALGLNIIVGYCGMCDLGYAAKFAVGAYTTAILMNTFKWSFWLTLPASVLVSALVAIIIGLPTLKLRSDYLAIVTLGFSEIVRITARNLKITGSATGINFLKKPNFFGIQLVRSHWYFIFLVLVAIFIFISFRVRYSRFGRALTYIKEDEDAARAMGINTTLYKLYAYIIGAVLGGIAGSFYAIRMSSISPNSFDFTKSANILLAVILGGIGKIPGVILGALFLVIFPELFRELKIFEINVGDMRMLFFGILLIIVMIFRPQGLWPDKFRKKRGNS